MTLMVIWSLLVIWSTVPKSWREENYRLNQLPLSLSTKHCAKCREQQLTCHALDFHICQKLRTGLWTYSTLLGVAPAKCALQVHEGNKPRQMVSCIKMVPENISYYGEIMTVSCRETWNTVIFQIFVTKMECASKIVICKYSTSLQNWHQTRLHQ